MKSGDSGLMANYRSLNESIRPFSRRAPHTLRLVPLRDSGGFGVLRLWHTSSANLQTSHRRQAGQGLAAPSQLRPRDHHRGHDVEFRREQGRLRYLFSDLLRGV